MDSEGAARRGRLVRLAIDVAIGLGLALLVLAVALLVGQNAPAFVYEMF